MHNRLAAQADGPAWATGGAFGLEASALTLGVTAIACGWLLRVARQRGHLLARQHAVAVTAVAE